MHKPLQYFFVYCCLPAVLLKSFWIRQPFVVVHNAFDGVGDDATVVLNKLSTEESSSSVSYCQKSSGNKDDAMDAVSAPIEVELMVNIYKIPTRVLKKCIKN